jgi:hypothetical protein
MLPTHYYTTNDNFLIPKDKNMTRVKDKVNIKVVLEFIDIDNSARNFNSATVLYCHYDYYRLDYYFWVVNFETGIIGNISKIPYILRQ